MSGCALAIDQGTTSSRALLFDRDCRVVAMAPEELPQHYPRSGWTEHDPEDIWASVRRTCRTVIAQAGIAAADIAAIRIANQRETALVWERATGRSTTPSSGRTGAPPRPATP